MGYDPDPTPRVLRDSVPPPAARGPQDSLEEPIANPEADVSVEDYTAYLQSDRELRDAVAAEGFAGPSYAVFEEEYAAFGYALMMAMLRSGYIFGRCREEGLYLPVLPIPASDHEDLAQESVEGALRSFKTTGLERAGWQPGGGASLRTYFVGALLRQFANIWRKGSGAGPASIRPSRPSGRATP